MIERLSKLTFFITALLTLSLATVPVYAEGGATASGSGSTKPAGTTTSSENESTTESDTPTAGGAPNETEKSGKPQTKPVAPAAAKAKQEVNTADHKLKQCQNRQRNIKTILSHIADRGQKQTDLFTTIATRVETFATTKDKKPANYDTLVAAVDSNKVTAQAAVDAIKTDSTSFNCDSTTPQAASASFKAELQKEQSALKDYRTAVKNLIVGVKSVAEPADTTKTTTTSTGGSN